MNIEEIKKEVIYSDSMNRHVCKRSCRKVVVVILVFFCLQDVYSVEINITDKKIEGYYRGVHTRSFRFSNEISAIGAVKLGDTFTTRGGLGISLTDSETNIFLNANYLPFSRIPSLNFSVSYLYNDIPIFQTRVNSIMPIISYHLTRAQVSIGSNFRFTHFFEESTVFETVLSFYIAYNIINSDLLRIGIGCGNFKDFYFNNLGAYSLNLYGDIRLNSNLVIVNDIEFMQSGGDGLTTTFYGIGIRAGIKFTW